MNRFWNTLKEYGILLILAGILCVYFAAICLINFSGRPGFYCTDMYTDIIFAQEAWEAGSLIPENWLFGNQLYVVATPALAALFCAVTENPQIAMAFAAVTMTALILAAFWWMLKAVFSGREERLLCMVLFMTFGLYFGDSVGTVNGWQLFFTLCAYYGCYLLNLLLAFGCYLRADDEKDWKFWVVLVITCGLSFGTGIQSLRQTAIMTLPLLAMAGVRLIRALWRKETWKNASLWTAAAISAANVAGLLFQKTIDFEQTEIFGDMDLIAPEQLLDSVGGSVVTLLDLLHSETGLARLVRGGILVLSILAAVELWRKERQGKRCQPVFLTVLLTVSVLAIFVIDVFTTLFVREIYYFVFYLLLAFLVSYGFSHRKSLGRWLTVLVLLAALVVPGMLALKDICMQAYFAKYDPTHAVSSYLLEDGYDTIYAPWNVGEDIAIASDCQIQMGFWDKTVLVPVTYLCDPEVYRADPERCVYALFSEATAITAQQMAAEAGTELSFLRYFPEVDVYLYTAPVNIMEKNWK